MIYRALDANGDYTFGKSFVQEFLVNTPATVAQAVLTALKLFQGEWFLDLSAGVPYSTEVLGAHTQPFYDQVLQEAILDVQGVSEIVTYYSTLDTVTRMLSVSVTINTIYGQASLNTVFGPRPNLYGQLDSTFILDQSVLG